VLTTNDPLAASLDVMAFNTYNGWYGGDRLEDLAKIEWRVPGDKPLLFSETGAGALAGLHQPNEPGKFSEEYQAEYYRQTLAMLARIPNFDGLSPWILKDFRSPRRQHPIYQQGWNRKGLESETGQRKKAFDVLAAYYERLEERREKRRIKVKSHAFSGRGSKFGLDLVLPVQIIKRTPIAFGRGIERREISERIGGVT